MRNPIKERDLSRKPAKPKPDLTAKQLLHLYEKIESNDEGCWIWIGGNNGEYGYGRLNIGSTKAPNFVYPHRVMWELENDQKIPEDEEIRHGDRCPGSCVRPLHLDTGTHQQNMDDAARTRRMSHGEGRYNAKLDDEDVYTILRLYFEEGLTHAAIGERYNISRARIGHIVRRQAWTHIQYP